MVSFGVPWIVGFSWSESLDCFTWFLFGVPFCFFAFSGRLCGSWIILLGCFALLCLVVFCLFVFVLCDVLVLFVGRCCFWFLLFFGVASLVGLAKQT